MSSSQTDPIPMLLWCPGCGSRHIDRGEFATKPHHTHACQTCGMVWRPAIVDTVGVQFLPGFADEEETTAPQPAVESLEDAVRRAACAPEIYKNGQVICRLDATASATEKWITSVRRLSGQPVDWHCSCGSPVVRCLGDRAAVERAMVELRIELDGRIIHWFDPDGKVEPSVDWEKTEEAIRCFVAKRPMLAGVDLSRAYREDPARYRRMYARVWQEEQERL